MSGIGIIANPHSKLNKRNPGRQRLLGYIIGQRGILEITPDLGALQRVAADFKSRGIETLAINGGDGTISRTLTAFIQEYGDTQLPDIAVLRGGTINVLANNLRVHGSPEDILFRLVESQASPDSAYKTVSTIKVQDQYGFLFATGVAPRFLREYYKRKSGPLGAMMLIMRIWLSRFAGRGLYDRIINAEQLTLKTDDGALYPHRSLGLFCSTLERMPLGPKFFELDGYAYEGLAATSFTVEGESLVWQLPKIVLAKPSVNDALRLSVRSSSLEIRSESALEYTLDGELYQSEQSTITVELGPRIRLRLV